jgi:hypothetical protein
MSESGYPKRLCPKCKQWSFGQIEYCSHCQAALDPVAEKAKVDAVEKARKLEEERAAEALLPPVKGFLRKLGRTVETVYLAIISFISWVLFWIAG